MTRPTPDVSVPAEEAPAATCGHCERPFTSERAHDLHVGTRHPETCSDEEWTAYERAEDDDREALFYLHVKLLVMVAILWMTTIFAYMIAGGIQWNA